MATYAALTNSAILAGIFEYFNSGSRRDVNDHLPAWARAARVCVAFYRPAISLLWRKLDSLVPLLNLLPSSFTKVRDVDEGEEVDTYMLNGNIEPQEWERMRGHAECVQILYLTHPKRPIALTTWVYLVHLSQDCPLLPNLRLFSCKLESPLSSIIIRALLSPSITDLLIYCDVKSDARQWEYSLRLLFDMVCSFATNLRRIDFTTGSTQQHLPLTVLSPIQRLTSLRILSLRLSSDVDFQSLRSVFFGMRSLEVVNFVNSHATDAGSLLETFKLDNLRTLSVASLAPSMDVNFYHSFSSPNLRVLRNLFHRFSDVWECVATFSAIAQSFPRIQELDLTLDFPAQAQGRLAQGNSLSLSLWSVMWQLSGLRSLASLTLQVSGLLDASTDVEMDELASAFPLLTTLRINCPPLPGMRCPSAATLVSFASRCPQLKTLRLPFMCVVERDLSQLANYPVLDHGLATVFFSSFDAADDHFAALLLDRLFPQLAIGEIRWSYGLDQPMPSRRAFAHVCDVLEVMQTARRQHEKRRSRVDS